MLSFITLLHCIGFETIIFMTNFYNEMSFSNHKGYDPFDYKRVLFSSTIKILIFRNSTGM